MLLTKEEIDYLLERSREINSTLHEGFAFRHYLTTSSAVTLSRAPIIIEHPREAKYFEV